MGPSKRCDFRRNGEACRNKKYREVHYSKSGKRPKRAWVDFTPAKFIPGRGLVRDRSKKAFKKFTWDFPDDMAWSYLCRRHFGAEKGAGRLIMWGSV